MNGIIENPIAVTKVIERPGLLNPDEPPPINFQIRHGLLFYTGLLMT